MCFSSGSRNTERLLQQQQEQRQQNIQEGVTRINNAFSGFTPEFYKQAEGNYLASALPQLANQYQANTAQLTSGLSNRGLLQSSAGQQAQQGLRRQNSLASTLLANQSLGVGQDLRQQVQNQKTALINQLQQSTDPTLAGQQALAGAASIQAPSLLSPLANMFQNFSNIYLADQVNRYSQPSYPFVVSPAGGKVRTGNFYY